MPTHFSAIYLTITTFFATFSILKSQNPICPPGVYIADPAAHVWKDGKLYIYGSLDKDNTGFCSTAYRFMHTADMRTWHVSKEMFASAGNRDQVPYNDKVLYAPDVHYKDGKYYLYYCQPDEQAEGVAVSDTPLGPFIKGKKINLYGHNQIDPGVFTDDDGISYYVWGQIGMKMAKLKPNMEEIDSSTIKNNILTEAEHYFHEGAHMVKRNGIYYLVYAHMGRKNKPTCIGYAMSKKPMGPYMYGGVIIDNEGCDPSNWNNHGSIVEFDKQWYVFYHRTTNNSISMRKACVEPISFDKNGFIKEVEMTSSGLLPALSAFDTIESEWACQLNGTSFVYTDSSLVECISNISPKDMLGYKYIDFGSGTNTIRLKVKLADLEGGFNLHLDQPWGPWNGYVHFPAKYERPKNEGWVTITAKIPKIAGKHALWFKFYGKSTQPPYFAIDRFVFSNE